MDAGVFDSALSSIRQRDTHRLIPSQYSVAETALAGLDEQIVSDLEGLTNDLLLSEHNRLPGINTRELVYGVPYFQIINAAFTYAHPNGSRFNGPDRGAWYAGFEFETSMREVIFHRALVYQEIQLFEDSVTYDDYVADFTGEFHDLRQAGRYKECLSPVSYLESQKLGEELLDQGSLGIVYPSVRRRGGACLVCFRPALIAGLHRGERYRLTWHGDPEPAVSEEQIKKSGTALELVEKC